MAVARNKDEKPRDASRRLILDNTARLRVKQGYGATALRDIAKACGMKAGSLYYHFDGKDALVEEILTQGVERVHAAVRAALEDAPQATPLDRIRIAMETHLSMLHDRSDYASAHIRCFSHVPPEIRQRLGRIRSRYEAVWTDLLESARAAGNLADDVDLHTLKFALIGMMNWTLEWRPAARATPEELTDTFFRFAFRGACHA